MRMAALAAPWPLAALLAVFLAIGLLTGFATSPAAAEDGAFCINGFNYDGVSATAAIRPMRNARPRRPVQRTAALRIPIYHAKVETQPGRERPSRRRN